MIGDVVAVQAAGPRLQIGRGVTVGDAEIVQVRHESVGGSEGEAGVELEAIRRLRKAHASADKVARSLD
jgi:hypothetical protein